MSNTEFEPIKCGTFDHSGVTPEVRKRMDKDRDKAILKSLISQLKEAKSQSEISLIENDLESINWILIEDETKDEWNEVLSDAKRGLYF